MPDLTLYGDTMSGNCQKVKYVADHLGIPYEWVAVDVRAGETRTDAFLKLNPTGKIPFARLSDGRTLPESNAIMLYLAEAYGPTPLLPGRYFPPGTNDELALFGNSTRMSRPLPCAALKKRIRSFPMTKLIRTCSNAAMQHWP